MLGRRRTISNVLYKCLGARCFSTGTQLNHLVLGGRISSQLSLSIEPRRVRYATF